MNLIRRVTTLALLGWLAWASSAWAAGNVVLIHGIRGDASQWTGTTSEALFAPGNDLKICTRDAVTTGWTDDILNQAGPIRDFLDSHAYLQAIGITYSMGSLTSREYIRQEFAAGRTPRLKTITTMGGLHRGAPIVAHLKGYKAPTCYNVAAAVAYAVLLSGHFVDNHDGTITYTYESNNFWTLQLAHAILGFLYYSFMGEAVRATSTSQFDPSSPFMSQLIAAEPNETSLNRVGITGAENFPELYRIGASAAGYPKSQVVTDFAVAESILWFRFLYYWDLYDQYGFPQDRDTAFDYASRAIVLGVAPKVWSSLVVEDHGGGSDAVVPAWSQFYPGANLNYTVHGVNHLDYMNSTDVNNTLHTALLTLGTNGGAYGEPRVPVLRTPLGGGQACPQLGWDDDCSAADFHVQVGTTSDFSGVLPVDQQGVVPPRYDVTGLTPGTAYYWRVRGHNAAGFSDWSATGQFRMLSGVTMGTSPPYKVSNWIGSLGAGDCGTDWFYPEPTNCSYSFSYRVLNGRADYYNVFWNANWFTFCNNGVLNPFTLDVEGTATNTYSSTTFDFGASFVTGAGGCPFVASWDGQHFVDDNNLLPAAEDPANVGRNVSDACKLDVAPVAVDGRYRVSLREFENEETQFDHVALYAVDHPIGTEMSLNAAGEPVVWRDLGSLAASTRASSSVARHTLAAGEFLKAGTDVDLVSAAPVHQATVHGLVLRGAAPSKASPTVVVRTEVGGRQSEVSFRQRTSEVAVAGDPGGGGLVSMVQDAMLVDARLAEFAGTGWSSRELAMLEARDYALTDRAEALSASGGDRAILRPGQSIILEFEAPDVPEGMTRSFVIRAEGTYRHLPKPETQTGPKVPTTSIAELMPPETHGSSIGFVVDKPSDVVLNLYDIAGRRQRTLLQGPVGAGRHDVSLTTADLPTGVYFVRLTGRRVGSEEGFEAQRKVVVQH
jgi:hypothetical protein